MKEKNKKIFLGCLIFGLSVLLPAFCMDESDDGLWRPQCCNSSSRMMDEDNLILILSLALHKENVKLLQQEGLLALLAGFILGGDRDAFVSVLRKKLLEGSPNEPQFRVQKLGNLFFKNILFSYKEQEIILPLIYFAILFSEGDPFFVTCFCLFGANIETRKFYDGVNAFDVKQFAEMLKYREIIRRFEIFLNYRVGCHNFIIKGLPLHAAAIGGFADCFEVLMKNKFDCPVPFSAGGYDLFTGCWPLHLAAMRGHCDVIRAIISFYNNEEERYENINQVVGDGLEPVCVDTSLGFGMTIGVDQLNFSSFTPLHIAIYYGKIGAVELLVNKGADLTLSVCMNGRDVSSLELAKRRKAERISGADAVVTYLDNYLSEFSCE